MVMGNSGIISKDIGRHRAISVIYAATVLAQISVWRNIVKAIKITTIRRVVVLKWKNLCKDCILFLLFSLLIFFDFFDYLEYV